MYHHVKKLMYTVRVDTPDPKFGNMLLEQFGGANGELAAAMQYSIQGLNCEDPERKDLLMDIGTEELSHLEIVGTLARMHLAPMKFKREAAEADPLIAIAGGGGVNLFNSQGDAWTADYLKITGELDVDLRSNIAAEARAKIVYERLINFCDDVGTKDALQFLMTREITHMKAFAAALESMGKPHFSIGKIAPTAGLVDQFFNDSTGEGDHGEIDAVVPGMKATSGNSWKLRIPRGQGDRDRQPLHPRRKFRTGGWRNDPGAARRSTARHPACGEAGRKSASQNGEGGPLPPTAAIVRLIWRRPKSRSSGSRSASACSTSSPGRRHARA